MPDAGARPVVALPRHLARGLLGFGCLFGAFAFSAVIGPVALAASASSVGRSRATPS